jgi:pyrroloquinoline quinone (PQQ) biosynthesis protein C
MEAELLLGKNLNLETMRAASLSGDEATVAKEMNRLLEENYDSTKGNKIQQKALADAMGVSVEELHSMNQARLLQKKMGDMDAKTRIAAEKEVNKLMATGLTHEEALNKLTKKKFRRYN